MNDDTVHQHEEARALNLDPKSARSQWSSIHAGEEAGDAAYAVEVVGAHYCCAPYDDELHVGDDDASDARHVEGEEEGGDDDAKEAEVEVASLQEEEVHSHD